MRLVIRTFHEKVDRTGLKPGEWGKVLRGEFEPCGYTSYPNETRTWAEFCRDAKYRNPKTFICWLPNGFRVALKSYYGIRSYQEVTQEPDL